MCLGSLSRLGLQAERDERPFLGESVSDTETLLAVYKRALAILIDAVEAEIADEPADERLSLAEAIIQVQSFIEGAEMALWVAEPPTTGPVAHLFRAVGLTACGVTPEPQCVTFAISSVTCQSCRTQYLKDSAQ